MLSHLYSLYFSTNIHRCTHKPVCTTTWPVVTITKPLPHLIQLRWKKKKKENMEENKTSDLSFLLKLGQRLSFAERKCETFLYGLLTQCIPKNYKWNFFYKLQFHSSWIMFIPRIIFQVIVLWRERAKNRSTEQGLRFIVVSSKN